MKPKVLVVDDDEAIRDLLAIALEDAGYDVCVASDGLQGLRRFRVERPDLVISDLDMPRLDGHELFRQVRRLSQVPIVIMTGESAHEEHAAGSFRLSATAFINKPFDLWELLGVIRGLLARSPGRASEDWGQGPTALSS